MNDREIEESVQKLAGTYLKDIVSVKLCTVDSVDKDGRTCDCTPISGNADTTIPKVRLMAEVNDGFLVLPKVNSTVMVSLSSRGYAYVFMYSDIDEVIITIGDTGSYTSYNIKSGLQQFNDGSFDGLVKVIELTQKLNNIENKFNDFVTAFGVHLHIGGTISGSTGTPTVPFTETLTPTIQTEIENTLITHGQ